MIFKKTKFNGVYLITPNVFGDSRGHFFESFNLKQFKENIGEFDFVQDNQALSQTNVLRGLHFQNPPFDQGKMVRVTRGAVNDVIVDLRKNSSTYGEVEVFHLTEENHQILWIPSGFAHGYETLEENTIFEYKVTNYYNPSSEGCLYWNDPELNIGWKSKDPLISEKDKNGVLLKDLKSLF